MRRLTLALILVSITLFGLMPTPAQALNYDALITAAGPAAYYRFGEASGSSAAEQIHSLTGTYGSGTTYGITGAITYDANTAIRLNGSGAGSFVTPVWQVANRSFAVELWFNFASGSTAGMYKYLFRIENSESYNIYATNSGGLIKLVWNHSPYSAAPSNTVSVDTWHYLVMQFNAATNNTEIYLDTVLIATVSDVAYTNISPRLYVGNATTANVSFDELALYERVLTIAEINQHYATAATVLTTATPTITYTPSITFTPTDTPTPTVTPSMTPGWDYEIPLPSGRTAAVRMEATAGDITVVMFIVFAVAIMLLTVYLRRRSNGS